MEDNKKKALAAALSQIERQFGKGTVMRLGDNASDVPDIEAISTGSLSLDIALGIGGLPKGRIVVYFAAHAGAWLPLRSHTFPRARLDGGSKASKPSS